MTLIELEQITKSVRLPDDSLLEILKGVDLTVAEADHVSIVGRSGSGKSTLLNILGLLDSATSGSVTFDGTAVRKMRAGKLDRLRGRKVGFVFQQFHLLAGRSTLENAMLPLSYSSGRSFWRRQRIAEDMLERVGLGHRIEQPVDRLSGGEQQRVAIARALVRQPVLILADEPTGALDIDTGESVMTLLDEVATETGAALVTITHDLHVAARARRHFRLDEGVLTAFDLEQAFAASTLGSSVPAPRHQDDSERPSQTPDAASDALATDPEADETGAGAPVSEDAATAAPLLRHTRRSAREAIA